MSDIPHIYSTLKFKKTIKKLHPHQKQDLDNAAHALMGDPFLGESKKEDLTGVRVYTFQMHQQLTFLAYSYDGTPLTLTLLALNFL